MNQSLLSASPLSRRGFVAAAGSAAALACAGSSHVNTEAAPATRPAGAPPPHGMTILFQGDSITDAGRSPQPTEHWALGAGYAFLIGAELLRTYPDSALRIVNTGVSGNKVPDLAARWEKDTIAYQPDILSVLIGVNDYWFTRDFGATYRGTVSDYENGFIELLEATRDKLPKVRFVILEPFVLQTGHVDASWIPAMDERRAAAARVAQKLGATFVPLQQMFLDVAKSTGPAYWLFDGVHPNYGGHQLIAEHWRAAVGI